MLTTLRQVYSKHSPTFIISLCPLVYSAVLLVLHPFTKQDEKQCNFTTKVYFFQLTVVIAMAVELLLRSAGISIVYKLSRQATTTLYTIFFFLFLVAHATLWIYSLILYFNQDFFYSCQTLQPHFFFIKSYAFVYAIMIALGTAVIIGLALPALVLTIKSFKKRNQGNS